MTFFDDSSPYALCNITYVFIYIYCIGVYFHVYIMCTSALKLSSVMSPCLLVLLAGCSAGQ